MHNVQVTRIENISVAHRLNSPHLSPEENQRIFGKCNNPHGHGHNYKLEVSVVGPVDPITGMVINLTDLKEILRVTVMDVFDHTNLDLDHPAHFSHQPSTTENFLLVIVGELEKEFERRNMNNSLFTGKMNRIVLWETEKNKFEVNF